MDINSWRKSLIPGQWVDVKNSKNEWCLAYIAELKNDNFFIRYDGYTPKSSEV